MVENLNISGFMGNIDRHPDQCPICHTKVIPLPMFGKLKGLIYKGDLEVAYVCPNAECSEMFIAYFAAPGAPTSMNVPQSKWFKLKTLRPVNPVPYKVDQTIRDISSAFCEIYNEALAAEQFGLTQICGVGYRKALEFLIKDYLIKKRPNESTAIKSKQLGPCIEHYIDDPNTKQVAKRATWLGNDETHYERRWIDKDLTDLKIMIDLVLHWIKAEHLTAQALASMSPP